MSANNDSRAEEALAFIASRPAWRFSAMLACCAAWFAGLFVYLAWVAAPLPNFGELDTAQRKTAFFEYLTPIVDRLNAKARSERTWVREAIEKRASGQELSWLERRQLTALAQRYEVDLDEVDDDTALATLDRRIGIIPDSLVLIQAAKESGWGTSRFATEGNNLFGQRCFDDGCGIAPAGREDPSFGVAAFDSVEAAIESYALNLNTHPRYKQFRDLRQTLRGSGTPLKGTELAQGLIGYSERGQAYVDEIKSMIRQNDLE